MQFVAQAVDRHRGVAADYFDWTGDIFEGAPLVRRKILWKSLEDLSFGCFFAMYCDQTSFIRKGLTVFSSGIAVVQSSSGTQIG